MSDTTVVDYPQFRISPAAVADTKSMVDTTVTLPVGVPFEVMLRPESWAHVVSNYMPGNIVRVVPEDGSWFAQLYVRDVGPNWVKVGVITPKVEFETIAPQASGVLVDGFHTAWQGPVNKYVVIRDKDNAVIDKGFKTKVEAIAAMAQHASKVAA